MRLKATVDTRRGDAQLDALQRRIVEVAIPRALRTLAEQAQTAGFREVNALYRVSPRTMEGYATLIVEEAAAEIRVKGKGFPLSLFNPVQTRLGVVVTLKGKRTLLEHTFMPARFGGRRVFGRGRYGRTFQFERGRRSKRSDGQWTELPINQLYTFGPADAFGNRSVTRAMDERIDEQAPKVLARELAAVKRGF